MKQDFDIWNVTKQEIEAKVHGTYVNEREICFVALGKNIGYEQDGKHERFERPVKSASQSLEQKTTPVFTGVSGSEDFVGES